MFFNQPILKRDAQNNVISESYISDMAFRGEYSGTNLIYKGYARPGTATSEERWQISRLTYDGSDNITAIEWPQNASGNSSSEFTFEWDNRATYTYS